MMSVRSYLKLPDVSPHIDMFAQLHAKHLVDWTNFVLFHCLLDVI